MDFEAPTSLPDPDIDLLIDLIPPPMEDWEREDWMEEEEEEEEEIDITVFFESDWLDDADWNEASF